MRREPMSDRSFDTTGIGVILGGLDETQAASLARLWFGGYEYEGQSFPALEARKIHIRQGYCAHDSGGTYTQKDRIFPCTHWSPDLFPTADSIVYDATLGETPHGSASSEAGAIAMLQTMLELMAGI